MLHVGWFIPHNGSGLLWVNAAKNISNKLSLSTFCIILGYFWMYVLCYNSVFSTKIKLLLFLFDKAGKCGLRWLFAIWHTNSVLWQCDLVQACFPNYLLGWYQSFSSATTSATGSQKCRWLEDTTSSFWVPFYQNVFRKFLFCLQFPEIRCLFSTSLNQWNHR